MHRASRWILAGGVLLSTLVFGMPNAMAGITYTPDVQIAIHGQAFKGDNIYNLTGAGQSVTKRIAPGKKAVFDLGLGNDGNTTGPFQVLGCAGDGNFKVTYTGAGGADITTEVITGAVEGFPAGFTSFEVSATIKATSHASSGDFKTCAISMSSLSDSSADLAFAKVKVK